MGVFYGFYHQRSINATQRAAAARREYEHKQALIDQAKAEYTKSKLPASATAKTGSKWLAHAAMNGFELGAFS